MFNTHTAEVMKVQVQILTDTSVIVSWKRMLNIPEITHYTVFYSRAGRLDHSEQNMNVTTTEVFVVIRNLNGHIEHYQFLVVAVATVDNVEILGERSINPVKPASIGGMDYYTHHNKYST